jgi:hypothetical protein
MKDNIFDFEKVNLIIRLAKTVIAKSGSYRITCKLNAAAEDESAAIRLYTGYRTGESMQLR